MSEPVNGFYRIRSGGAGRARHTRGKCPGMGGTLEGAAWDGAGVCAQTGRGVGGLEILVGNFGARSGGARCRTP